MFNGLSEYYNFKAVIGAGNSSYVAIHTELIDVYPLSWHELSHSYLSMLHKDLILDSYGWCYGRLYPAHGKQKPFKSVYLSGYLVTFNLVTCDISTGCKSQLLLAFEGLVQQIPLSQQGQN